MNDDMDRLIGVEAPGDAEPLFGVEDAVWAPISVRRDRARVEQVRIAVVALALAVGITNGGLMLLVPRPEPSEMRIFTISAGLFPLASLGVEG